MVEKEQDSRIANETLLIKGHISRIRRGQVFGLLFAFFGISVGAILGYYGAIEVGVTIAGGAVIAITLAFLSGQKRSSNRAEK